VPALDERLARAKAYLAIAESKDSKREAYKRAAKEIAAYKDATKDTYDHIAIRLGKSKPTIEKLMKWHRSGYEADTPFLADTEAVKRAARSHAKAVVGDINEATKLIAGLNAEQKATLGTAIANDPSTKRVVEDAIFEKSEALRHRGSLGMQEPKFTLLHRIEGDRVRLNQAAELMVGHWHDGRPTTGEEELSLVRDSMAQAVIEVEQIITGALRSTPTEKEVRD